MGLPGATGPPGRGISGAKVNPCDANKSCPNYEDVGSLIYFWFLLGRAGSTRSNWSCGRAGVGFSWNQGEFSSG